MFSNIVTYGSKGKPRVSLLHYQNLLLFHTFSYQSTCTRVVVFFFEVFKISPTPFLPSSVGGRNLWLLGNQQNFVSIFTLVAYSLFSVTPTQIYLGYSRIKPQIEISLKKERALLC